MDSGSLAPGSRSAGPGLTARRASGMTAAPSFWRTPESILIGLLMVIAIAISAPRAADAAETRDAASFFNLNMGDLRTELADARKDGKKALLVMFEQEGCPYCLQMKRNILNRKDVQDYYRANFATLALDIWSSVPVRDLSNREQTEKAFAQSSKVKATPTFVFYDLTGNEVARVAGTLDTPEEFLLLGEFVTSGAYKTRTFTQYKRDKPGDQRKNTSMLPPSLRALL
jgi:thioredoxin-related protein